MALMQPMQNMYMYQGQAYQPSVATQASWKYGGMPRYDAAIQNLIKNGRMTPVGGIGGQQAPAAAPALTQGKPIPVPPVANRGWGAPTGAPDMASILGGSQFGGGGRMPGLPNPRQPQRNFNAQAQQALQNPQGGMFPGMGR